MTSSKNGIFFWGGEEGQTFVLLSLILESSSGVMKTTDKLLFFGSFSSTHEMIFWKAYRMNTGWEGWLPEEPARLRGVQPSFPFLNIVGGQRDRRLSWPSKADASIHQAYLTTLPQGSPRRSGRRTLKS